MDFNRRNFLKGVSLAAFAGAAGGGMARAEGTTLVLPEMAKGRGADMPFPPQTEKVPHPGRASASAATVTNISCRSDGVS